MGGREQAVAIVTDLLAREGQLLDRREWRPWLDLYEPDATYWVPAWRTENAMTSNPDAEVSLIYHDSRDGLEDRVVRLESHQSLTAMPLPRTAHFAGSVVVTTAEPGVIEAEASWMVQVYQPRGTRQWTNFGRCELRLLRRGADWRFARKKIHLLNDCTGAVLDFYLI